MKSHMPRSVTAATLLIFAFAGITSAGPRQAALESLATRFARDVYPLLSRQANGCAVCHNAQSPQLFQVLDSAGATFSLILEHDLLAPEDPMAIPGRLSSADPELRMPKAGDLSKEERDLIQQFALDSKETLRELDSIMESAPDERFPDALLLSYDGPVRDEPVSRRLSYYQLRRSFGTLFGQEWLEGSGRDPFGHKANRFGGADFRASFDASRAVSASYLANLQEVAREVARRYVSAPKDVLFEGFDPDVHAGRSRKRAARNVKDRPLYHASAVAVCGLLTSLVGLSADLWSGYASPSDGLRALLPLVRGTVESLEQDGLPTALTGPLTRGDEATVASHLSALEAASPDLLPIYCRLALAALPMARAKGGLSPDGEAALESSLRAALARSQSTASIAEPLRP